MSLKIEISVHLTLLIVLLTSCSSAPTSVASALPPTNIPSTATGNGASPFESGKRYYDTSGDMEVSILDVVAFQATVNQEEEMLDVLLWVRDIPDMVNRTQPSNLIEYSWTIDVYLTPADSTDLRSDYKLSMSTPVSDASTSGDVLSSTPGQPDSIPFYDLFVNSNIYNSAGQTTGTVHVDITPDRNTLRFTGHVPGITTNAVFSFDMSYNEDARDQPDGFVPAERSTPSPEIIFPAIDNTTQLVPIGNVHAFPGPKHYAGDILTFEIETSSSFDEAFTVSMALDDGTPVDVPATFMPYGQVLMPMALDTTDLSGQHRLTFTTADGELNETYFFEVLTADQRPKNEDHAVWLVQETDCCIFHYLSDTAAARDIDFISEHFQQGANEFEKIMQAEIGRKVEVYIIDRILRNGAFGGSGKVLLSYTDRYYGPTVNGAGMQILARHELSHAADISLEATIDGVEFDYEGLALYVAGGHFKTEPLAQRAAALFDLGHSVPVNEIIPQHELSYLHAAAILTYIEDTYDEAKVWEFLKADTTKDEQLISMKEAIQLTFGISLEEFDQGFQAWLEKNDPGEQLDDLRLTIELQDLRREYQDVFASEPRFLQMEGVEAVARPENLPIVMREAHAPSNIAVELIIAHGQQAIVEGDYARAQELIRILGEILSTGKFEDPLAKEYLDIVLAATKEGYEVLDLDIQGDQATARLAAETPTLLNLNLQKIDGTWQIQP
ncbi:MAG TPA: hypothetical protein VFQ23_24885 [Anaerolineales bacterium]|nr:hypothetical protein [Anaerolineales bacterium]